MNKITLAAAALLVSSTASAAGQTFQWSATDLTTLDGVARTHQRIEATARHFCRNALSGTRGVGRYGECIQAVVDELVGGIDDPRLTAYAHTGTVDQSLLARR